jgi:hypothetical protein
MSNQQKAQQLFDKLEKIKAQVQERFNAAEEISGNGSTPLPLRA